ncbi:MAG: septum formation protein Maf [Flavobacteriales bacterium]|nr:septum formation protein Maf [Flavobacteriales bacterium]
MWNSFLNQYEIILASASPRRQAFLHEMQIPFRVEVIPTDESFPNHLKGKEITEYIALQKAKAFTNLQDHQILITSDTLVLFENEVLAKPANAEEAKQMLQKLSGKTHEVITSICLKNKYKKIIDSCITLVTFELLSNEMIDFYVQHYSPLDKAGAYGIQEWIGHLGVSKIDGSYNNVVGLPTHLLFQLLKEIV